MKTHDLARPLVGNQTQVHKGFLSPHIGNISHPNLIGSGQSTASDQLLKHGQMRVKMGRAWPSRGLWLHQQTRFAQLCKEPVPAHFHPRRLQLHLQHVMEFSHSQARLVFPFRPHQLQDQLQIHFLSAPGLAARVIVLWSHLRQAAEQRHFQLRVGRDRLVRRPPACFFLNASNVWSISSQATTRKALSNASSICVSASASLTLRSSLRSCWLSFTSSAFSTRTTLPYRPLPNCRTQPITVPTPLILYLRRTAQALDLPLSTSLTNCSLKALL